METVLPVMLNAGNCMDENCVDATTASNLLIPVLRKELSCCRTWESEEKALTHSFSDVYCPLLIQSI